MSLTCDCDIDWCPDAGDWYWCGIVGDYKPLNTKRRKRCCSCEKLIDLGSLVIEHGRVRTPKDDVEINIYGDDGSIPLASSWMCEKCSDHFFSLEALGYCVDPKENMEGLLTEYINKDKHKKEETV